MRIRPITREDIPAVATITNQAFKKDELMRWLFPNQDKYPDDMRRFQKNRIRFRIVDPAQVGYVAVTEEEDDDWSGKEEVTGYAFCLRCGKDEGAKKRMVDSLFNKLERQLIGWELWYEENFIDRARDAARDKEFMKLAPWDAFKPLGPRWHLSLIGVSPKHQRRGIGGMLVEHGQKIATEEGLPMTLESSLAGRRLYCQKGFKIVHEVEIGAGYVDGFMDVLMAWEPEELRGKWLDAREESKAEMKV